MPSTVSSYGYWVPAELEAKKYIKLKVKNQHDKNEDAAFVMKMRKTTKLQKLMTTYCNHLQIDIGELTFVFDGHPLKDYQTPNELKMEDKDVIDAMIYARGG